MHVANGEYTGGHHYRITRNLWRDRLASTQNIILPQDLRSQCLKTTQKKSHMYLPAVFISIYLALAFLLHMYQKYGDQNDQIDRNNQNENFHRDF